jgi:hypothetical protein
MTESLTDSVLVHNTLTAWDPLAPSDDDVDMFAVAQKREIRNILKSYTGYYDLFSEMIQNALDAVEKRATEKEAEYVPTINIAIDLQNNTISVSDNRLCDESGAIQAILKAQFLV